MKLSANGKRIGRPPIFTPEERKVRDAEKRRERDRKRLKTLTEEQKQRRREADSRYKKKRVFTDDERALINAKLRDRRARKKASMSPEEIEADREKKRAYMKNYKLSDEQKARASERQRAWHKENAERIYLKRKERIAANPIPTRLYAQKRRALKASQLGNVSPDIVDRLLAMQKSKCAICGSRLDETKELDHIEPISKGGLHDDANLQLCCRSCNRKKGARDPIDFMQSLGMLL